MHHCNKAPQTKGLKNRYFATVLRARKSKPRSWWSWFLPRTARKALSQPSLLGLEMAVTSLCFFPSSPLSGVSVSTFPLLIRTPVLLHLSPPSGTHSTPPTTSKTCLQIQSCPEMLGVGLHHVDFEGDGADPRWLLCRRCSD